jgi:DNA replication protein DnaC
LALRRAFELDARCAVLPAPEIRITLWQSFESASKVLEKAAKPTVLLIDDLGQGAKSEQADEVLLAILERRVASGKPCIVTTQYSPERIIGRFFSHEIGEAIVRRIGFAFATSVGLGQNKP